MRTQPSTLSLTLSTFALALAAGCVGAPDGAKRSSSRESESGETGKGSTGPCERVDAPVTIRSAADFDKLPTGCWDLYATLRVEGTAITSVAKLGKLRSVNDLELVGTGLATLDVAQPIEVWGAIAVTGNSRLTSLDKLAVYDADDLTTAYTIRNNAALTSLAGVAYAKTLDGELRVSDNPALGSLVLDELTTAGAVTIANNGISRLDLGSLAQVGRIEIASNSQLSSITGTAAARIGGDLVVRGNRALASLGTWSGLERIDGDLAIDDNDALASLGGLGSLSYVSDAVALTNNALLDNIDVITHLGGVGAAVVVTGNANLSNCRVVEIDHCVPSGAVTASNNKPNTGTNCSRCWCE